MVPLKGSFLGLESITFICLETGPIWLLNNKHLLHDKIWSTQLKHLGVFTWGEPWSSASIFCIKAGILALAAIELSSKVQCTRLLLGLSYCMIFQARYYTNAHVPSSFFFIQTYWHLVSKRVSKVWLRSLYMIWHELHFILHDRGTELKDL